MEVKDNGVNVYIDFGDGSSSEAIQELYDEGFISQELYNEATERQEELDKQPF